MLSVQVCPWSEARDRARAIRYAVFVEEQGVPVELEWDEWDEPSWHALAVLADGTAVATGRLLPDGHIGRMAVLKSARGTGVGAKILHAQTHAAPFYARAGFEPVEEFEEAGIPHGEMRKRLR